MIPAFPQFKSLEPADRKAVEAVVHSLPAYSDFNFTNLYAWDHQVSSLHGNLAIRNSNYYGIDAPFFSFIGNKHLAESAAQLLDLAKTQSIANVLRLVPESVALVLAQAGFVVAEDETAHDYVYAVDQLANMDRWVGHSIRQRIRRFSAKNPGYTVRNAPLHAIDANDFRALFVLWEQRKGRVSLQASQEYHAFERFLRMTNTNIETAGLYVGSRLVGFSAFELLPDETAIVHFSKADHAFHGGICDVLYWEESRLLHARRVKRSNWQQDLGLPGLKKSKRKYQPCNFLKKFVVHAPSQTTDEHDGG